MKKSRSFIRVICILTALVTVALMGFAPVTAARAEEASPIGTAVCTASRSMNLRSEPSTSSKVAVKLPARTFVKVYAQSGKWYQVEYKGIMAWGISSSLSFAPNPDVTRMAAGPERSYTTYYQSDTKWKFSTYTRKNACVMTSYAIIINDLGIPANPRFIYESNRRSISMNFANLTANFGVTTVCALGGDSPYLKSFDGKKTYVVDPGTNGIAAIKAAIDRNPEGVLCYFKKGSRSHAIVACCYDGDTIYFSDPSRTRNLLYTFNDTWVYYKHKMTYKNLNYMVALDPVA